MKKQDLIVLTANKFDQRDSDRFGISLLQKNGIHVLVIDLSGYLRSQHYCETYHPLTEIQDDFVRKVNNIEELVAQLRQFEPSCVFALCLLHLYPDTKDIFKLLSKFKIRCGVCRLGTVPTPQSLLRNFASRLKYYLLYHLMSPKIKAVDVAFVAGRKSLDELGAKITNSTKVIHVGSTDYNSYLRLENSLSYSPINFPDIVFIDVAYASHPDDEGWQFIDPVTYYSQVNNLLDRYSSHFNLSCGIAAHPRRGKSLQNPFNFPLIRNRTAQLIHSAKIVIAHYSTSLSYAVLGRKPIVLLGIKSIRNLLYGRYEEKFAEELGLKLNYIDDHYTLDCPPQVNVEKYNDYIKNYLIDTSEAINHADMPSALLRYIQDLQVIDV